MQKNMFFTEVKHIMDPEVEKIEPGAANSDAPSDAIILFVMYLKSITLGMECSELNSNHLQVSFTLLFSGTSAGVDL